ncbi:hypothetical protein ACJJTC_003709 [Scirpophaga incertulas]
MFSSTVSLATHIVVSSFKLLHSVSPLLEYVSPYWTMASKKINVNTKHLAKGDPLPPYNGKLRVYNMRFCPYAHRTILVLNAKQVDYEVVNINLMDKPEWLTNKSPFGKVPSIEIEEGVCIYESVVTAQYLDEVYPQRPLISKDPLTRAFDRIIIESFGPINSIFYNLIKNPATVTEQSFMAYYKTLDFIQEQLNRRGTKFLGGEQPGYVDYMIWPWFERIVQLDYLDGKLAMDASKYSLLNAYCAEMFKDPAISQYLVPTDVLKTFLNAYSTNITVDYDLLLDQ